MSSDPKKRGKHKSSSRSNPFADATGSSQTGTGSRERVVVLDVGGIKFSTRIGTVMGSGGGHEENMLSLMFSGRFPLVAEEDGSFFIDRDGTHFRYILNFLRDSENFVPPSDSQTCRELLREVEFYQLAPLIRLLRMSLVQFDPYLLSHDLETSLATPSQLSQMLLQHPTSASTSIASSTTIPSTSIASAFGSTAGSSPFSTAAFPPASSSLPALSVTSTSSSAASSHATSSSTASETNSASSSHATLSSSPEPPTDPQQSTDSHVHQPYSTPLFLPPVGMKVCRHSHRRVYCTVRYLPGSTYDGWPIRIEGPLESKIFFCLNGGVPFPEKLTPNVKNIFGSELFGWKFRGIFITKIFNLLASNGWRIDTSNGSGGGKEKNFAEMYIFSKYASPVHYAPFALPSTPSSLILSAATASLSSEAQAHDHHHHHHSDSHLSSPTPVRNASQSIAMPRAISPPVSPPSSPPSSPPATSHFTPLFAER